MNPLSNCFKASTNTLILSDSSFMIFSVAYKETSYSVLHNECFIIKDLLPVIPVETNNSDRLNINSRHNIIEKVK